MNITVYLKSGCPWAAEVLDYLKAHDLPYKTKDMFNNSRYIREVEAKSGQSKSPTLDIDGEIIPDAGVEDVAKVLEKKGVAV